MGFVDNTGWVGILALPFISTDLGKVTYFPNLHDKDNGIHFLVIVKLH